MSDDARSPYSAAEQGLGYIYQARFALWKILELPEESSLLLEKEDDVDFDDAAGRKSLLSLKHKAVGDSTHQSCDRLLEISAHLARALQGQWQDQL